MVLSSSPSLKVLRYIFNSCLRLYLLPVTDFKNTPQACVPVACNANCIAARNVRDFAASPMPAITSEKYLAL